MEMTTASKDERMWAMIAHFSAFAGHFFPFGHILGPLVVLLIKKDQSPFAADQAKESLNCQISYTLYFIVGALLCLLLVGFVVLLVLYLADIIFVIVAGIKANEGVRYRYPGIIRFVK